SAARDRDPALAACFRRNRPGLRAANPALGRDLIAILRTRNEVASGREIDRVLVGDRVRDLIVVVAIIDADAVRRQPATEKAARAKTGRAEVAADPNAVILDTGGHGSR